MATRWARPVWAKLGRGIVRYRIARSRQLRAPRLETRGARIGFKPEGEASVFAVSYDVSPSVARRRRAAVFRRLA